MKVALFLLGISCSALADRSCPFDLIKQFRQLSYAFPGLGEEGGIEAHNQISQVAHDILQTGGIVVEIEKQGKLEVVRIVAKRDKDAKPLNLVAELVERKLRNSRGKVTFAPYRVQREDGIAAEVAPYNNERHLRLSYKLVDDRGEIENVTIHELVHVLQDAKEESGDFNLYHGALLPPAGGSLKLEGGMRDTTYDQQGYRFDELLTRVREIQFLSSRAKLIAKRADNAPGTAESSLIQIHLNDIAETASHLRSLASGVRRQVRALHRASSTTLEITRYQLGNKHFARVRQTGREGAAELMVPLEGPQADVRAAYQARLEQLARLAERYESAASGMERALGDRTQGWEQRLAACGQAMGDVNRLLSSN